MYADVGDEDVTLISSITFVAERQALFQKALTVAPEMLGKAAERSKKRYDMRVKPTTYKVGDWVYYFCPRHRVGQSPKWQRFYSGPFLVIELLGAVNLSIQKSARANPMVVYIDKVKQCMGETPVSWLSGDEYNVLPTTLERDVLTKMFGGTDKGWISTSGDDVDTTVIERPKRVKIKSECVDNSACCVLRFSDMKKAAKKTDFDYKCFPCREQDDKARSNTRSYDLILHMVNTHLTGLICATPPPMRSRSIDLLLHTSVNDLSQSRHQPKVAINRQRQHKKRRKGRIDRLEATS